MNRNRQRLFQDSILYCRSYALEAERKMGQILAKMERAKGGQPHQKARKATGNTTLPVEPTLAELGITKRESADAQMLAETERAKAGRPPKLVTAGNQLSEPTLDELGVSKREMGQILAETERAKPPGDNQHKKQDRSRHVTEAPTLDELGLTKREMGQTERPQGTRTDLVTTRNQVESPTTQEIMNGTLPPPPPVSPFE